MRKITGIFLFVLCFTLTACENSNIFSWAHSKGSSSSKEALLADGRNALSSKDYAKAIDYFNKVLAKDPDNSEALYSVAEAEMKNAGLNIADMIAKAIDSDTSGTSDLFLAPAISAASSGGSVAYATTISLNTTLLEAGSQKAMNYLKKIADGQADGVISPLDKDVNLNLAIVIIIYRAMYLINKYSVSIKDDFNIVYSGSVAAQDVTDTVNDISSAITYLERTGLTMISEIKSGFETFKTEVNNL